MAILTEADVEAAALEWLADLGWQKAHGPDIAPGAPGAERDDYRQPVLERRLRDALDRLNPALPSSAVEDALRKLTQPEGATLEARNRAFHRLLVDGVTVEYRPATAPSGASRPGSLISRTPRPTTGWRSTSSRSRRIRTPVAPTSCCSSTDCPWASLS